MWSIKLFFVFLGCTPFTTVYVVQNLYSFCECKTNHCSTGVSICLGILFPASYTVVLLDFCISPPLCVHLYKLNMWSVNRLPQLVVTVHHHGEGRPEATVSTCATHIAKKENYLTLVADRAYVVHSQAQDNLYQFVFNLLQFNWYFLHQCPHQSFLNVPWFHYHCTYLWGC